MEVIIKRTYFKDATVGFAYIPTKINPIWVTLERPWENNERKVSCIPEGEYLVKPYSSVKFPDVWEITNVPDRDAILFHAANFVSDLKGCIAPGLSFGYIRNPEYQALEKAVSSSRNAIEQMKRELSYPSEFNLKIVS